MNRAVAGAIAAIIALAPAIAAACETSTPSGLAACVDQARYTAHLKALAAAPREVRSPGLEAARQRCRDAFAASGFGVRRHEVDADLDITNVIGRRKGTDPSRPAVVIGAHIDSVPNCNGANDNASGVAAVLEMARVLGRARHAADLYVACWDAEEFGQRGSRAWVEMAKGQKRAIDTAIVFEQIGNRQTAPNTQASPPEWYAKLFPDVAKAYLARELKGDFIQFIYDSGVKMDAWDAMARAGGVPMLRGIVPRAADGTMPSVHRMLRLSDHAQFWAADYSAVYITDTGPFRKSGYHCQDRPDDVEFVDMAFATAVTRAATVLAADRLGVGP